MNAAPQSSQQPNGQTAAGQKKGSLTVFLSVLPVLIPFLAYVWLQTPSGANTCRSETLGRVVSFACKEEWLRVDDSSADKWFAKTTQQIDGRLSHARPPDEIWESSFIPMSASESKAEKAAFEQNWSTTLHLERLGVVVREDSDTNTFTYTFRRYFHSASAKDKLGYTADRISVEEDAWQVSLRFQDGRIVGMRPDRTVTAALDPANQARMQAVTDTHFYADPSTDAPGRTIGAGKTVWVLCTQRVAADEKPVWGRTISGWVHLASFKDTSQDLHGTGDVYYCVTNE